MNLPKIFMYQGNQVRTVIIEDQPWLVAKDVCDILEIQNTSQAIQRLDPDEVTMFNIGGLHGETNLVNEPGLYSLILGSRKKEAKAFKRWITHEVLPSIRKHGAYMTPQTLESALLNPDGLITVLTKLKEEQAEKERERQARLAAEARIQADLPKVLFADSLQTSNDSILIGELAKLLKQNGIDVGGTRLFKYLREEGYLIKSGDQYNLPTQRSMDLGIMEIKTGSRGGSDGAVHITRTTKITGKGQIYFMTKFKKQSA